MESISIEHEEWAAFFEELKKESDRASAILVVAYMDSLLGAKFKLLFGRGNAATRRKLLEDASGPFATFSAKVDAAYCLGWLEPNVFCDLHALRKIRNMFAHQMHGLTFEEPKVRELINGFRVPHEFFYDWGDVRCGARKGKQDCIVLFTGEPDDDVVDVVELPPGVVFRWAASFIIAKMAENLGLCIRDIDAQSTRQNQ